MAEVHTYKCDVCGTIKKETNHWFIGLRTRTQTIIEVWNTEGSRDRTACHLCGIQCSLKWVGVALQKASSAGSNIELVEADRPE